MSKPQVESKPETKAVDEMVRCKTCGTMVHKNKAVKAKDGSYTCGQE